MEGGSNDIFCAGATNYLATGINFEDPRKTYPYYETGSLALFSEPVTKISGEGSYHRGIYGTSWVPGPINGEACPNVVIPNVSSTIW